MSAFRKSFLNVLKNNRAFGIILFLECCVLLIMAVNCLRTRCDYLFTSDNLYTPSGLGEWIFDENGTGYQAASGDALGDNILVNTDFFVLYPGSYTVKVTYESQVSYLEETDYTVGTGLLNLSSSHNEVYYHFDGLLLRDGLNSVEQSLQVTSPWKISDFQITLHYSGQGSLTVYSIEITENVIYKYLGLLGIFALFVFLDIFCCLMFLESGYSHKKELGILTLIILAACLPFFADWVIVGEDSAFWAARIRLLAETFAQEEHSVSVQSILIDSGGYTALEMYGSLFLYLPAFLFHCGFSLTFVYNFYICTVTVLTCLITYFSGLSVFHRSNPALLASAMYTLSAPRLTCILSLGSLGEMTAMAFFPLILAGFWRIYIASFGKKVRNRMTHNDTCLAVFCCGMGLLTLFLPSEWLPFAVLFGIFCICKIADSVKLKEIFCGVPVILLLCAALTFDTGQIYSEQMRTASMERLSNNLYENLDGFGATGTYMTYLSQDEG